MSSHIVTFIIASVVSVVSAKLLHDSFQLMAEVNDPSPTNYPFPDPRTFPFSY